ncbi:MAG: DegT/DnrJ/EryC1/StrS family aminotransferase [Desulfosudaceae bacterium]
MPGFEWYDQSEREQVNEVLSAGVLFRYGYGPSGNERSRAKIFETELSQKIGAGYCHLCSSGTAALTVALAAAGIGAGDEVIVPPFTFVATFEALLNAGAVPVFSEIDETLCLDPDRLEEALTPRTRAVMPVHMCGGMARIDAIQAFCEKKGLVLLEDACQALGATFNGKYLGTFGRAGCFSFDPVKTITCGEGGAVVTNDQEVYVRADAFADHGHDHIGVDRGADDHVILGANYRISELNAAVGLAQLRKLDLILETQRRHKQFLKEALSGIPDVSFRDLPDPDGDSATFLSFFLPDEDRARAAAKELAQAGVDGCFYWYDNNWHYLRQWDHLREMRAAARLPASLADNRPDYRRVSLPRSEAVMSRCLSLLIKLAWTEDDLAARAKAMKTVLTF